MPTIGTNVDIIYMAKLVDFIGYYSQVVPNAEKKKSWEKTANHVKFEIIISQCIKHVKYYISMCCKLNLFDLIIYT